MKEIISSCGYRCDACGAFVRNSKTAASRRKVADRWKKYFKLRFQPDKLRCSGCLSESSAACPLPAANCEIRECVLARGMVTCADCFDYPCAKMETRMARVEKVISKYKDRIPTGEFAEFIAPYDARKNLDKIRDRRVDRLD